MITLEAEKEKGGTTRRIRKMTYAKVLTKLKAAGKTPEAIMKLLKRICVVSGEIKLIIYGAPCQSCLINFHNKMNRLLPRDDL